MSTVIENIDSLFTLKSDIRQAIEDKGVDMSNTPFTSFAAKIGEISTGSDPNLIEVSVLQGEQTQEVIPEWYGDDVDGFTKVRITLDPSLPDTYKTQALNELTEATATEEDVAQGQKYYDNKGVLKTGTMQGGGADHTLEDALVMKNIGLYTSKIYSNPRVSKIGPYAFVSTIYLQSVDFQNATSISMNGFAGAGITSYSFPNLKNIGINAFSSCQGITTASFPNVVEIENGGFYSCQKLSEVNMPECTTLWQSVFAQCSSLTSVYLPKCSDVSNYAFSNCVGLVSISLPECSIVRDYAFQKCNKLETIELPKCSSIGTYTFGSCYALKSISLPLCTYIGTGAFRTCSSLSYVSIPECSVIGTYAFNSLANLKEIYAPKATVISAQGLCWLRSLTSLVLGKITSVGSSAFYMTDIKDYDLDFTELSYIGTAAFSTCSLGYGKSYVRFPKVTTIAASGLTFTSCTVIDLPIVSTIGSSAFQGTYFSKIYIGFGRTTVPTLSLSAFSSTPIVSTKQLGYYASIYVPTSLLATYKAATNWKSFSARMVGLTSEQYEAAFA